MELLLRGILVGLIITAPVGPVNVLCIKRTLTRGWLDGVISGLGSAVADTFYGAIAAFSISIVIRFLLREEPLIRLVGGVFLMGVGVLYFFRKPREVKKETERSTPKSDFVSTFFLTITNPTTVLSFLAVMTALGLAHRRPLGESVLVVLGIFCGAMLWWIFLSTLVNHFRERIHEGAMPWMNRAAGVALGIFGMLTFVLGLVDR